MQIEKLAALGLITLLGLGSAEVQAGGPQAQHTSPLASSAPAGIHSAARSAGIHSGSSGRTLTAEGQPKGIHSAK